MKDGTEVSTAAPDPAKAAVPAAVRPQAVSPGGAAGVGSLAGAAGERRRYGLAVGALVLLALIWGYTWPVMKIMLTYADPFPYAAMRTFIGGLVLVACLPSVPAAVRPKAVGLTALLGVLQTAGFPWADDLGAPGRGRRQDGHPHLHHAVLAAAHGLGVPGGEAQGLPVGGGRSRAGRAGPGALALAAEGGLEPVPRGGGALSGRPALSSPRCCASGTRSICCR